MGIKKINKRVKDYNQYTRFPNRNSCPYTNFEFFCPKCKHILKTDLYDWRGKPHKCAICKCEMKIR